MSAARWITVLDEHPQFFENAGGEFPLVLRLRLDRVGPLTAKEIEELHQRAESYHADAHRASTSPRVDRKKIEESIKKEYMQVDEAIMNVKMYDSIKEAYRKAYNWENVEIKEVVDCLGGWLGVVSGMKDHEEICFVNPDSTVRIFGNTAELALVLARRAQSLATQTSRTATSRKVFLVHGHDQFMREAVARFLLEIEFEPIILQERVGISQTIIEKIEAHSDVGFALVLFSADDEGQVKDGTLQPRVRQNVLFELGYFVGLLGRARVCALKRGDIEIPSDWAGVIVNTFDEGRGWRPVLAKVLEKGGYLVDWNKVMK